MTDGTVERKGNWITLRYERRLTHPVDVVWRSLTDTVEVERWFGGWVEIDLRGGGAYVTHHATGDRVVDRITRLEPPRLLEHTYWAHLNPEARVTYELESTPEGCRLVLTHRMTVDDLSRAAKAHGWEDPMTQVPRTAAGWHVLLDRLRAVLDGEPLRPMSPDPDLVGRYAAELRQK